MSSHRNMSATNYLLPENFPSIGELNSGPQPSDDAQPHWTSSNQAHHASYIATELAHNTTIRDIGYTDNVYHETTTITYNHQSAFPSVEQSSSILAISPVELSLPSHDETEEWLRNHLKIPAPQPLNLWCLRELVSPKKLPNLTEMIFLAIWGSPYKRLALSEIYTAIEDRYPTLRTHGDKAWQRSIRHRLSLKACFVRIRRDRRGADWMIDVSKGLQNSRGYKVSPPQSTSGSSSDHHNQSGNDSPSPFMGYSSDSDALLIAPPQMSDTMSDYTFASSGQSIYRLADARTGGNLDHLAF